MPFRACVALILILSACSQESSWGPLAVLDIDPDDVDAMQAGTEGTIRITDECVFLNQNGRDTLLLWDDNRVQWDADSSQITHRNLDGASLTISDGDQLLVGGGSASQDFPDSVVTAWASEPADACLTGGAWVVGEVYTAPMEVVSEAARRGGNG